jgi:hypothetical protein
MQIQGVLTSSARSFAQDFGYGLSRREPAQVSPAGPIALYAKVCGGVGRHPIKSKDPHSGMKGSFVLLEDGIFMAAIQPHFLELTLRRALHRRIDIP